MAVHGWAGVAVAAAPRAPLCRRIRWLRERDELALAACFSGEVALNSNSDRGMRIN